MNYGFVKVAAVSPRLKVADVSANTDAIIEAAVNADSLGVKLVVTPELAVTGATCGDLFLQKRLVDSARDAVARISEETAALDCILVVGAPVKVGAKLYDCAVAIYQGMILGITPKSSLEPSEARWFAPAPEARKEWQTVEFAGQFVPFGLGIVFRCSSLPEFTFGCELGGDRDLPTPPSVRLATGGATVIANLAASPEIVGRADFRRLMAQSQSARLLCGYVTAEAGCGESTTDSVFAGHSIIAENGTVLAESKPFENALDDSGSAATVMVVSELDVEKLASERGRSASFAASCDTLEVGFEMECSECELTRKFERLPFVPSDENERRKRCESILELQAYGLRKRIEHAHASTCVIGISGGLDSCLALLVAVRAMALLKRPSTDVIAVTMPCFGTTARTRSNAELLCERLGVSFRTVDIKAAVEQHFADIGHDESNRNVVYENSQARERTQIIMDIANAVNGLVIGTGDLSELALGWATYNGDHMSSYGVNGSIPKTLVRYVVRTCAENSDDELLARCLYDILDTPVSPELLPSDENGDIAQKTEDLVGPYELHDFFIFHFLRSGFAPEKLMYLAKITFAGVFDDETVEKWLRTFLRRFFIQQFKRSCLPDGVRVGTVTLSPRGGYVMPSDASFTEWLN